MLGKAVWERNERIVSCNSGREPNKPTKATKSARSGNNYSLRGQGSDSSVTLKVNMADRSDADRQAPGGGVVSKEIDTWNGLEFVSDPLPAATELSGLFSGRLDFLANKKDFDFEAPLAHLVWITSAISIIVTFIASKLLEHLKPSPP